jgi:nitric oxide reductase subunit C
MSERFTKAAARNIFFGGSLFFFVVFIALVGMSHSYVLSTGSSIPTLNDSVARGKHVWEKHSCINCHSLLGEGAYFAPELGNVWIRYEGHKDADGAATALKSWMRSQPSGIEGRRQMPQFNLTEKELDDLVAFFEWTSRIKTQNWPPHVSG